MSQSFRLQGGDREQDIGSGEWSKVSVGTTASYGFLRIYTRGSSSGHGTFQDHEVRRRESASESQVVRISLSFSGLFPGLSPRSDICEDRLLDLEDNVRRCFNHHCALHQGVLEIDFDGPFHFRPQIREMLP